MGRLGELVEVEGVDFFGRAREVGVNLQPKWPRNQTSAQPLPPPVLLTPRSKV